MSLYSRYSESSISVSYFSRSSPLICHSYAQMSFAALLRGLKPGSHLSSPLFGTLSGRVRSEVGHQPGARPVRHAPDIDERIAVLWAGTEPRQRATVCGRAVALVFGEA